MCNFWSCIIDSKGKIYSKLGVDSHTELEKIFGFRDNSLVERAKIELLPAEGIEKDVQSWKFVLDEEGQPSWWNKAYEQIVRDYFKENILPKHFKRLSKNKWEVREYCSSGQLCEKLTYKEGNLHGVSESYYENGQLRKKTTYKEGNLHGIYESYYENGQLRIRTTYKEGHQIED